MPYLQQLVFILMLGVAFYLFVSRFYTIFKIINSGKKIQKPTDPKKGFYNMFLLAFGQKKMFNKPIVASLHLMIYVGFFVLNIELVEILIDGIFGTHRGLSAFFGVNYRFLINAIEWFALFVLISCIVFLIRRNLFPLKRLKTKELSGWPSKDGNIILIAEIFIISMLFTMNGADTLLQIRLAPIYSETITGNFHISSLLHSLIDFLPTHYLLSVERISWWLHISAILIFLVYITYSKHLHIFLSFPNTYFSRQSNPGRLQNMPLVQQEVKAIFEPTESLTSPNHSATESFGVRDIPDLTKLQLLNAFSCTECGRCSEVCPATQTGKKLSPRKIMMSTRDRAEEWGKMISSKCKDLSDGKSLLHDYITYEEINGCTTCNACVEACPINISPVEIIMDLRRYLVMEKGLAPREWTNMFTNIENNFAPWPFTHDERLGWTENMD